MTYEVEKEEENMTDPSDDYVTIPLREELASMFDRVRETLDVSVDDLIRQGLLYEYGSDFVKHNQQWPIKLWFTIKEEQYEKLQELAEKNNLSIEKVCLRLFELFGK